MGACSAPGCKNRTTRNSGNSGNSGVSFHRFPKKRELQDAWVAAMKRDDWRPNSSSLLCSVHFREEDMDRTSLSCIRLRDNVVPSLFPTRTRNRPSHSSSLTSSSDLDHCYGLPICASEGQPPVASNMDTSLGPSEHSDKLAALTAGQDDNSYSDMESFTDAAANALRLLHQASSLKGNTRSSGANLRKPVVTKENMQALSRDQHPLPHLRPIAPKPVAALEPRKEDACFRRVTNQQPSGPAQVQVLVTPGTTKAGTSLLKKSQSSGENTADILKPDGLLWGLQLIDATGKTEEVVILKGFEVGKYDGALHTITETQSHAALQTLTPQEQVNVIGHVSEVCIPRIGTMRGRGQCASTMKPKYPVSGAQQPAKITCASSLDEHIRILKAAQRTAVSALALPANPRSDDDEEKMQLWNTIQMFKNLHNADRKKIKALQESVRRLRQRNERLKKGLADKSASLPVPKRESRKVDESQARSLKYMDPPCCCCTEDEDT